MIRTKLAILVGGMCFAGMLLPSRAAEDPSEDAVRAFMRGKLDAAENVLEGLVTEDFKAIQEGADRMRVMGQRAEWNVIKTPEYIAYSAEFQRAADQLSKSAQERKLDAASLTYLQLTLTCINCHKHARGAKIAGVPNDSELRVAFSARRSKR